MKRLCAFLLTVSLALTLFSSALAAGTKQSGPYRYTVLSDGTAEITRYTGDGNSLDITIPETVDGYTVSSIGRNAFMFADISTLTIGKNVRVIGENAFFACSAKSVSINAEDIDIGAKAFGSCSNLDSFSLIANNVVIGRSAFMYTSPLRSFVWKLADPNVEHVKVVIEETAFFSSGIIDITIPGDELTIGEKAFSCCTSMKSMTALCKTISIGYAAFMYATLESFDLPNAGQAQAATEIGENAFFSSGLKSFTVPASVLTIGKKAFSCSSSLTSVVIPPTVESIETDAFLLCNSSLTAKVVEGSPADSYCKKNRIVCEYVTHEELMGLYGIAPSQTNQSETLQTQLTHVSDESWSCPNCGNEATGYFCSNCGSARPQNETVTQLTNEEEEPQADKQPVASDISELNEASPNGPASIVYPDNAIAITKGIYFVGRDIQPGSYNILLTGIERSATVGTFRSQSDLDSYRSWSSANNLKQYAKMAVYAKPDQYCHVILERGDYLYISDGNGFITPFDGVFFYRGIYRIGSDIEAGSYNIEISEIEKTTVVATFASPADVIEYFTWDSANNLKAYSTSSVDVKNGTPRHISLKEGEYLYIAGGTAKLSKPEDGTVVGGMYYIGKDISAGSYEFTLSNVDRPIVVAIFDNPADMVEYTSWNSDNNLKQYSKVAIHAEDGIPFHFALSDGDILYISAGEGSYTSSGSSLVRGVYKIGQDIPSGSCDIMFANIDGTSVVATFATGTDLTSYITWNSKNILKQYSTFYATVSNGEHIHLTLSEGELLYISNGTGTIIH